MKRMHLICNAHIDPMWQWDWEEGIGCAISTFRVAAQLCDQYDSFVFNHNEAVLYKWILEYEPQLFAKIQDLVKKGKWHIMGGWFIQPDCNMPSGESFVRQIEEGQRFFKKHFNVVPTTAINFDSFGHTKGLVQIIEKAGYDSYIICRPYEHELKFKESPFIWNGFAESKIKVLRMPCYNSGLGLATQNIARRIEDTKNNEIGVLLWGVGNHGGGPSKEDLKQITAMAESSVVKLIHSTPEEYFSDLAANNIKLNEFSESLQHTMIGCYTSQIRIKQLHRKLENELIKAEKMCTLAVENGLMEYPQEKLNEAWEQLLFAEFHDILPGSSIQKVEDAGIRILGKGIEDAKKMQIQAFYKLAIGQKRAVDGELPILVFNPHPYEVETDVECEFMLADQNYNYEFINPVVYDGNTRLKCQCEKELSNIPIQWRKKVVFNAKLKPLQINRFDAKFETYIEKPLFFIDKDDEFINVKSKGYSAKINLKTGLIDSYVVNNVEYFKNDSFKILAIQDNEDPWGMIDKSYMNSIGCFTLCSPEKAALIAGISESQLAPVRVIEDGEVRTIIEAIFTYNQSQAVVRYTFYKETNSFLVNLRIINSEKSIAYKLIIPTMLDNAKYFGKTAFGEDNLKTDGSEVVAQSYVYSTNGKEMISVISDSTYGSSYKYDEIYLTLMRAPAYCAHPIGDRKILPQDRFTERIEQGERIFNFEICAGEVKDIKSELAYRDVVFLQKPQAISFFPPEYGKSPQKFLTINNKSVIISALKMDKDNKNIILRLFNSLNEENKCTVCFKEICKTLCFKPYEVNTYLIDNNTISITSLIDK